MFKRRTGFLASLLLLAIHSSAQAQWKQTNGPYGARLHAVVADALGLTEVTDRGEILHAAFFINWSKAEAPAVRALIANPVDTPKAIWAIGDSVLIRSTDNGGTWTTIRSGKPVQTATLDGEDCYLIEGDSLLVSKDLGASWQAVGALPDDVVSLSVHAGFYFTASGSHQLTYRSKDGMHWTQLNGGLPPDAVVQDFRWSGTMLLAACGIQGVYRSADSGTTWSAMNEGLPKQTTSDYVEVQQLATIDDPVAGLTTWARTMDGLYRWSDSGWFRVVTPFVYGMSPGGTTLFLATDDGLYTTASDGAVELTNDEWVGTRVTSIAGIPGVVYATSPGALYFTITEGNVWSFASAKTCDALVSNGRTVLAHCAGIDAGEGLLRTTVNLGDIVPANGGLVEPLSELHTIAANTKVMLAGYYGSYNDKGSDHWMTGGVYRSIDDGVSWLPANEGLPMQEGVVVPVLRLYADDERLFALTLDGLYRADPNANLWTKIEHVDDGENVRLTDVVRVKDRYYLGSDRGVFESTDAGTAWQKINGGLNDLDVSRLLVLHDTLFAKIASTNITMVWRTGAWTAFQSYANTTEPMAFATVGDVDYMGTAHDGVFTKAAPLSVVYAIHHHSLSLETYPNPMHSTSRVRFNLQHSAVVNLTVIDASGRTIERVLCKPLSEGSHEVECDLSHLAAGSYHYHLESEEGIMEDCPIVLW